MSVLLIAASPSTNSRSARLLGAAAARLQHLGLSTQTLHLRELPAQALLHAEFGHPAIVLAQRAVAQAQAVVLATPIYKAAYSGLLKVFLDVLPQDALAGKPVWALATGGSQAHLLALDYALAPVLAALGSRGPIAPLYATDDQVRTASDGTAVIAEDIQRRLSAGAAQVLALLPEPAPELARC